LINEFEILSFLPVADDGDPKGVLVSKTSRFNQIITNSHWTAFQQWLPLPVTYLLQSV